MTFKIKRPFNFAEDDEAKEGVFVRFRNMKTVLAFLSFAFSLSFVASQSTVSCSLSLCAGASNPTTIPLSGDVIISGISSIPGFTSGYAVATLEAVGFVPFTVHGFHIHAAQIFDNNCTAALGHLSLDSSPHSCPVTSYLNGSTVDDISAPSSRHTGDLGNVYSDAIGRISLVKVGIGNSFLDKTLF